MWLLLACKQSCFFDALYLNCYTTWSFHFHLSFTSEFHLVLTFDFLNMYCVVASVRFWWVWQFDVVWLLLWLWCSAQTRERLLKLPCKDPLIQWQTCPFQVAGNFETSYVQYVRHAVSYVQHVETYEAFFYVQQMFLSLASNCRSHTNQVGLDSMHMHTQRMYFLIN